MDKVEDFLQTKINDKDFAKKFLKAIKDVRREELEISLSDFLFNGDPSVSKELKLLSLEPSKPSMDVYAKSIVKHLEGFLSKIEETNKMTLFRGTRLPTDNSSFEVGGIHTTPQLSIAKGYASGSANNSTGVGRLMNEQGVGFVSCYEVDLSQKTYSNFQYEDFKKRKVEDSELTLGHLKESVKKLTQFKQEDFYYNEQDIPSPALRQLSEVADRRSHYEAILPNGTEVKSIYLTFGSDFLKLSLDNPKVDMLLARVQEANLRDFYEIIPLEKAQSVLERINKEELTENEIEILEKAKEEVAKKLEVSCNAPWEAEKLSDVSLIDSEYINKRPHIKNSNYVGSAMEQNKTEYDPKIQRLVEISEAIYFSDYSKAKNLLVEIEKEKNRVLAREITALVENMKKDISPDISPKKISTDIYHNQIKNTLANFIASQNNNYSHKPKKPFA